MGLLEVEKLTKFFGGLGAVHDVCFSIQPGEVLSLIGPNGAGKTTLFNLVTGYLKPTGGRILYEGKEITALSPPRIAEKRIVRTFQKTHVFPGVTVLEGVMMGCHLRACCGFFSILGNTQKKKNEEKMVREKSLEILDFTGLTHKRAELSKNLPYGELRLVEIAVALAVEPKVLLLDEPTAGMNPGGSPSNKSYRQDPGKGHYDSFGRTQHECGHGNFRPNRGSRLRQKDRRRSSGGNPTK